MRLETLSLSMCPDNRKNEKKHQQKNLAIKKFCQRGWSLCEIIDQAGAGFNKPGQQQRLLSSVEAGQDDYIKEICSPEGLTFNPVRL